MRPSGNAAPCADGILSGFPYCHYYVPIHTQGDQLIATSGVTYNSSDTYGEVNVKKGQEVVRLRVQGETFKTVSAAIGSHPGR